MHLLHCIATGLGRALDAIARVVMAKILPEYVSLVPTYILLVNVIACLIMGFLSEIAALHYALPDNLRYFLISGFLGGFTTFLPFLDKSFKNNDLPL